MADDRDDAGHAQDRCRVDAGDAAEADRRADDHRIGLARLVEFGRIAGAARDLGAPVDAGAAAFR